MARVPRDHRVQLGVLTGAVNGNNQLTGRGKPQHRCNPCLKQFGADLNELGRHHKPAQDALRARGWFSLFEDPETFAPPEDIMDHGAPPQTSSLPALPSSGSRMFKCEVVVNEVR
eukprot:8866318-Pyramimonas_sp.AAC.1